ncbi:hypothetical protein R50072_32460 [Simiduia litorea]
MEIYEGSGMKQVCIDDDFLVGDDIFSLRCGVYDQVQFKSLQFRDGPKKT